MINRRVVLLCILLAFLAVALQTIPSALGGVFAFAAFSSGFPIYIAARLNCILGIVVFSAVSALLAFINISEALFFICVSGIVGLTLGITKGHFKSIYVLPIPADLIAFGMLSAVNHLFGIGIFDNSYHDAFLPQALALVPPLYIYCFIYLRLSMLAENLIRRSIELSSY